MTTEQDSYMDIIAQSGFSVDCLGQALDWLNEGVLLLLSAGEPQSAQILFANSRYCEMVGYDADEIVGRLARDFYDEDALSELDRKAGQIDDQGRNKYEFFIQHKDGHKIPVLLSAQVVQQDGEKSLNILICTDISGQKRIQAELEAANQRLRDYQEQMADDLQLAEEIQHQLIPAEQRVGPLDIASLYVPMIGIGGDYVYVRRVSENKVYLTVCDVVGHGIAAALTASFIQARVSRILIEGVLGPDDLIQQLNLATRKVLRPKTMFFSFAAAELDLEQNTCTVACAGHPPVLHISAEGRLTQLGGPFTLLGIFHPLHKRHEIQSVALNPGDRVVLFTDGITEARSPDKDRLFGQKAFEDLLLHHRDQSGKELCREVHRAVLDHTQSINHDDISMLVATYDRH